MKRSRSARQLATVVALPGPAASAARIGVVAGISPEGHPLVEFPGDDAGPLPAASTVAFAREELEAAAARRQQVVLLLDAGDPRRPIVIGLVAAPAVEPPVLAEARAPVLPEHVEVDGKRVTIEGMDEIVLRCGEASITLRRNGKIVLRGTYLESHSRGTNRIKGGSVQIN